MKILSVLFIFFISLSTSLSVFAEQASLNSEKGVFIDGYDPVSYLAEGKAVKGKKKWTHKYKSSKVLFSSEENLKKFIQNPKKFLPAYNGWCAYAMAAKGSLVRVNPERFKVIDGKTYLFFDDSVFFRRVDTLEKWNKSSDESQIKKADVSWFKNHIN